MSLFRETTEKAKKYLTNDEILLFIGARQTGKTTILRQIEEYLKNQRQQTHFLNLEDPDYLTLLNESPKNIFKIFPIDLKEKCYLFLDEVQYLKNPSNFLKYLFDEYHGKIQLLVSGSSAFYIDEHFHDSLAGRKKIFSVYTLSFREFLFFKGEKELSKKDFQILTLSEEEKISLFYREYIIYGGYPRIVLAPLDEKEELLRELVYSYIKKDVLESGVRNEDIFYRILKLLAGQIGQLINASEFANTLDVSKNAVDRYLFIMRKSFHVEFVKPFSRNIRKEITKMPKCYFLDLGIRNFLLNNFTPFDTRDDKGQILENALFRQLINQFYPDEIRFWRTTQGHEIDFIVKEKEAFEVKVDSRQIKEKNYGLFKEYYKDIPFGIVSLDIKETDINNYPTYKVWKI